MIKLTLSNNDKVVKISRSF